MRPGPALSVLCARTPGRGRRRCERRSVPAPPTGQVRPASHHGRTCCAASGARGGSVARRVGDHRRVVGDRGLAIEHRHDAAADIGAERVFRRFGGDEPRRAAISGSMPASHSPRCTSIVALGISAFPHVVEVRMGVDDEVDFVGISVDRFETRLHIFAGLKADAEMPGEPRAEPFNRVALAIGMQPGVE